MTKWERAWMVAITVFVLRLFWDVIVLRQAMGK